MQEFSNILKDIKSSALPVREIPGFIAWSIRNSDWFWPGLFMVILAIRFVRLAGRKPNVRHTFNRSRESPCDRA